MICIPRDKGFNPFMILAAISTDFAFLSLAPAISADAGGNPYIPGRVPIGGAPTEY